MVRCETADGTVVEAKQKTIPSLRVGRFTINNVVCVVMPAGKGNVAPLLGQSFHRHFTHKFTPESGHLILSKVEAAEPAQSKAVRPRRSSTKAKRTAKSKGTATGKTVGRRRDRPGSSILKDDPGPNRTILGTASRSRRRGFETRTMTIVASALLISALALLPENHAMEAADQIAALVRGNNAFALDLYAQLRQGDGNRFFSPLSISTALAMTYAGAEGETALEMAKVLHFDLPADQLHAAFHQLIAELLSRTPVPARIERSPPTSSSSRPMPSGPRPASRSSPISGSESRSTIGAG